MNKKTSLFLCLILALTSISAVKGQNVELEGQGISTVPGKPKQVGLIEDGATTALNSPHRIFIAGQYAYVASRNSHGMEILDISDPSRPRHVGAITDGGQAQLLGATDVFVQGGYAYVAARSDDALEIIDITDPHNPIHAGVIEDDGTNTALNDPSGIYVRGSYAYVTSSSDNGLEIVDISDPANPQHAGMIVDDAASNLSSPNDIDIQDQYAYIVGGTGLAIVDISDPANPTHIGMYDDHPLWSYNAVEIQGHYAYVVTSGIDNIFAVIDVLDPTNPVLAGFIEDDNDIALLRPLGLSVSGNYAFVAAGNDDAIAVIDVSDPTEPTYLTAIVDDATTFLDSPEDIIIQGTHAFVTTSNAIGDDGVTVLDLRGASVHSLQAGAAKVQNLAVGGSSNIAGDASIEGGLTVGEGGILVEGDVDIKGALHIVTHTDSPGKGKVYSNTGPMAYGYISSSGMIITDYGISSVSKPSTGVYKVYLDNDFTINPVVLITPYSTTAGAKYSATYWAQFDNEITVNITNESGLVEDQPFSIMVMGR